MDFIKGVRSEDAVCVRCGSPKLRRASRTYGAWAGWLDLVGHVCDHCGAHFPLRARVAAGIDADALAPRSAMLTEPVAGGEKDQLMKLDRELESLREPASGGDESVGGGGPRADAS